MATLADNVLEDEQRGLHHACPSKCQHQPTTQRLLWQGNYGKSLKRNWRRTRVASMG